MQSQEDPGFKPQIVFILNDVRWPDILKEGFRTGREEIPPVEGGIAGQVKGEPGWKIDAPPELKGAVKTAEIDVGAQGVSTPYVGAVIEAGKSLVNRFGRYIAPDIDPYFFLGFDFQVQVKIACFPVKIGNGTDGAQVFIGNQFKILFFQ